MPVYPLCQNSALDNKPDNDMSRQEANVNTLKDGKFIVRSLDG